MAAFKNILIPYDGSTYANRAFNNSLDLAKRHDSNLRVVACLDVENLGGWYIDKRINKDIMKKAKNLTEKFFSNLNDVAKKTP